MWPWKALSSCIHLTHKFKRLARSRSCNPQLPSLRSIADSLKNRTLTFERAITRHDTSESYKKSISTVLGLFEKKKPITFWFLLKIYVFFGGGGVTSLGLPPSNSLRVCSLANRLITGTPQTLSRHRVGRPVVHHQTSFSCCLFF